MPWVNPVRSFRKYLLVWGFGGEAASLMHVLKKKLSMNFVRGQELFILLI